MAVHGDTVNGSSAVSADLARSVGPSELKTGSWVRWLQKDGRLFAFIDGSGEVELDFDENRVDLSSATIIGVSTSSLSLSDRTIDVGSLSTELGPACISFKLLEILQ
jgi:hypothetical protein